MDLGNKQPLNEVYISKLELVENNSSISESSNTEDRFGVLGTVEGPFAEIEHKNRNNRYYPKELWEGVLESDYVKEMMENKTLFGEGDHPEERFEISLPEVSHCITDLWIDESTDLVMGRADILDTPKGNIIYTLVEYGSSIGISARAAGSLKERDDMKEVVADDYTFFTFDIVANPGFGSSRLGKPANDLGQLAANNDRMNEEDEVDYEGMKEALEEKIRNAKKENLDIIKSVVQSISEENKNYKGLIDIIEERQNGNRASKKDEQSKGDTSQENTISLLEESYRRAYQLEKEKEKIEKEKNELKEKLDSMKDEVNRLSEKQVERAGNEKVFKEVKEQELKDFRERVDKLEGLVQEYRTKLEKANEAEKHNEELDEFQQQITELQRKAKSKVLYSEVMENRVKDISENKVELQKAVNDKEEIIEAKDSKIQEKDKELKEKENTLENIAERYNKLEDYVISQIAGRTGVREGLVRKYVPEGFNVENISTIEKKIKDEVGVKTTNEAFTKKTKIGDSVEDSINENNSEEESSNNVERLSKLVGSVKGK